jgi:hypothetical protein
MEVSVQLRVTAATHQGKGPPDGQIGIPKSALGAVPLTRIELRPSEYRPSYHGKTAKEKLNSNYFHCLIYSTPLITRNAVSGLLP